MNVAANLSSLDKQLNGSRGNINNSQQKSREKISIQAEFKVIATSVNKDLELISDPKRQTKETNEQSRER